MRRCWSEHLQRDRLKTDRRARAGFGQLHIRLRRNAAPAREFTRNCRPRWDLSVPEFDLRFGCGRRSG